MQKEYVYNSFYIVKMAVLILWFQVAMLKNTRHENLLLFMGACMKPPHLAIVTR